MAVLLHFPSLAMTIATLPRAEQQVVMHRPNGLLAGSASA